MIHDRITSVIVVSALLTGHGMYISVPFAHGSPQSSTRWEIVNMERACAWKPPNIPVKGYVSPSVDLTNDDIAKQVLEEGLTYALRNCNAQASGVSVSLHDHQGQRLNVEGGFTRLFSGQMKLFVYSNLKAAEAKELTRKWGEKGFDEKLETWKKGLLKEEIWKMEKPDICEQYERSLASLLYVTVMGFVPSSTDLANEQIARKLLHYGKQYALKNCSSLGRDGKVTVNVYSPEYVKGQSWEYWPPVSGTFFLGSQEWIAYDNKPAQLKRQEAERRRLEEERRLAEEARQAAEAKRLAEQRAVEEQRRKVLEEQRKTAEAKARAQEEAAAAAAKTFITQYQVKEVVRAETLNTNVFRYKGKKIAMFLEFSRMVSENVALFRGVFNPLLGSIDDGFVVVTEVPSTLFEYGYYTVAVEPVGLTQDRVPYAKFLGYHKGNITKHVGTALGH